VVLESIIGEKRIRRQPYLIGLISFVLALVSIFIADQLFPAHGSVLSVAFITIALVSMIHNILNSEEADELLERKSAATFFARHFNVIMLYVWVFIGIIFAFTVFYTLAPAQDRSIFFSDQISAFCQISGGDSCKNGVPSSISGKVTGAAFNSCQNSYTKDVVSCTSYILENNAKVLGFILFLSFFYGAGAIFIIAWNASILGVFFGEMFLLGNHVRSFGFLQGMLIGHGPPELFSYIFGALAGAILSAAISKGDFFRHEGTIILKDVIFLIILAFFSVIYGAATEALGLMGWADAYYIAGFAYVLVVLVAVFVYHVNSRNGTSSKFSY
jgi:hypothetical protein